MLTLAALSLAVAASLPASAQITGGTIPVNTQGTFNLAQAYPAQVGTYPLNLGIAALATFNGACGATPSTTGAVPGTLCLKRTGFILDVRGTYRATFGGDMFQGVALNTDRSNAMQTWSAAGRVGFEF